MDELSKKQQFYDNGGFRQLLIYDSFIRYLYRQHS